MANQTGRPIAPARKLVAAVLGTISVFVMLFGLGLSSWPIVALGAALLALSIVMGMVNVVRRGARAWVNGVGQVKAVSEAPLAGAYGRAELQLTVVAPGLPVQDVLVRDSRVPVGKWPRVGDTLPISVDVDDMRRVKILWDEATDRNDDGDPPPPPVYDPADELLDDDLLGEPEPPPWANRDRQWARGADEPPPPPPADADSDTLTAPLVVRDTPTGRVVDGEFIDHDDTPPPLPQRPRTSPESPAAAGASGPDRPPGAKPSPHPRPATSPAAASAATATIDDEGTGDASPEAAATPADPPAAVVPEQRAAHGPGSTGSPRSGPPPTRPHEPDIDLPLDGDPEPPPESTPAARQAVAEDIIAPPATDEPAATRPADQPPTADSAPAGPAPADSAASSPPADQPTITGVDTPAGASPAEDAPAEPPTDAAPAAPPSTPTAEPPTDTAEPPTDTAAAPQTGLTTERPADAAKPPTSAAPATPPSEPTTKPPTDTAEPPTDTAEPPTDTAAPPTDAAASTGVAPPAEAHPAPSDATVAGAAFTGVALGAAARTSRQAPNRNATDPVPSEARQDEPAPAGRPWADLEGGGFEPDDRADDIITGYPSARPGPAAAIHGVGVTVLVTDLQRSIAFYRDTLGFYEIDNGPGSAVLASGDTRLVLRSVHTLSADIGRLIYLNLEVGDIDAVHRELKAKGTKFEHSPRPVNRGSKLELWAATFYDPDGHNIAITQWKAIR